MLALVVRLVSLFSLCTQTLDRFILLQSLLQNFAGCYVARRCAIYEVGYFKFRNSFLLEKINQNFSYMNIFPWGGRVVLQIKVYSILMSNMFDFDFVYYNLFQN